MLFGSNFKRFGESSSILRHLRIGNAEYIDIGDHVHILYRSWIVALKSSIGTPRLVIDDYTKIGSFATIGSLRDIYIGKSVLIADRAFIADNIHGYEDISKPIKNQTIVYKGNVHIGDGSWIGTNVVIIGAKIGKHCVIGANTVVTQDIPDFCVAAGSPARIIKKYNFEMKQWLEL